MYLYNARTIHEIGLHFIAVCSQMAAMEIYSNPLILLILHLLSIQQVPNARINSHGLLSAVTYLPQSDTDIVTLACWAMNTIGRQSFPCLVHILPARKYFNNHKTSIRTFIKIAHTLFSFIGVPEPPRQCELRNDSILEVICQAGNDGGLQQHFILEAVGATSMYFNNLDSTRSTHEIIDNEISTMNDQVRKLLLLLCA